ncbi:MAG: DUF4166 domain-containing protein [Methylococcaceae bacterium]
MLFMQRVLGEQWRQLPIAIQRHYQLTDGQISLLEGKMNIRYPVLLFPLIWIIHLFGGLVLWRGNGVNTQVKKMAGHNELLYWQRRVDYIDGNSDYFNSQMLYIADHEVKELIGFGFGLRLAVNVINGDLVYRSLGHYWQCGKFSIIIADYLLLGTAIITEHALSENSFYLDFKIEHPLWGETYSYCGEFHYMDNH